MGLAVVVTDIVIVCETAKGVGDGVIGNERFDADVEKWNWLVPGRKWICRSTGFGEGGGVGVGVVGGRCGGLGMWRARVFRRVLAALNRLRSS